MKKKPKILAKYCRPHNLSEFSFADKFCEKLKKIIKLITENIFKNKYIITI